MSQKDQHKENFLSLQLERQMINSFYKAAPGTPARPAFGSAKLTGKGASPAGLSGSSAGQDTNPAGSPASHDFERRIEKLESLLNFYSDLHRQSGAAGKIDVREGISGKEFFDEYYYRNKPVILRSMMDDWPAMGKWSPDFFIRHYGQVPVEVTKGREKERDYEKEFRKTVVKMPFGEFIEQIRQPSSSNDIYLVARNYFFSNPQFRALRDDIIPPASIIDSSFTGLQNIKAWFGPRGTVTPLHHDKHSILFCQLTGRKQFKMIPSFELPRIYNQDRYYSEVDPERVDPEKHPLFLNASVADVVINPGEMLFIPAGWWHWVRSLDLSISVTFSNFRVPGFNMSWNCV